MHVIRIKLAGRAIFILNGELLDGGNFRIIL